MPVLTFHITVSDDQLAAGTSNAPMVLLLTKEELAELRATVGGMGEYATLFEQWRQHLEHIANGDPIDRHQLVEALVRISKISPQAPLLMNRMMELLGKGSFAEPIFEGETLQ